MSAALDASFKSLPKDKQELLKIRHTAEHLLHQAVVELFPGALLAMGPATEDGFYCDVDTSALSSPISPEDFPKLLKRIKQLCNKNLPMIQEIVAATKAKELFAENPYKLEWIDQIEARGETVSLYWTGNPSDPDSMVDLCSGPHAESSGKVGAVALLSVAGAYWHGDETKPMLTRIYGTAFATKEELDTYLDKLKEASLRDHKILGKQLDLYTFSDVVGKGLPLWTPKGSLIRRELERFVVDEEISRGYLHVYTPDIANLALYQKSGHYPYYKDSMYAPITIDDEEYMLRPMTCPHHFELYLSKPHSYKELPIRYAELAQLYRYEQSGELSGLQRVRTFCLADAHIIARRSQAETEINGVLDLIEHITKVLGLEEGVHYHYRLSLGDRANEIKYFKDDEAWDHAEEILRRVLVEGKRSFVEAADEAAFYGPKIDIQMKNVHGKEDTAFTVQYDFVMPKRFELAFANEHNQEEEAIVIHRSSIGAIERSIAFLIEHYAGAFPTWLSPVQMVLIPIAESHVEYALSIQEEAKKRGLRVEVRIDDSLSKRIRTAEKEKVPYMGIIGDQELQSNTVSLRGRGQKDHGVVELKLLLNEIEAEVIHKEQLQRFR